MLVILPPVILNSAFMPAELPSKGMNRLQAVHPQSQLNVLAAALRGVRDSLAHEQGSRPESEIDTRSSTPLPTPEPDPPYPLLALHPLSPSPSPEGKSGSHPPRFRVPPQQASIVTAPIPPPFSYCPNRHAHDARSETSDSCRRAPSHVWTTSASSAPQPPGPLLTSEGGRWLLVPPPKPACRPGIRPLSLVIPSLYPSHWDTPGSPDPIAQLLQGAFGMLFPPCPLTPTGSEGEGDVLPEGGGMGTLMARHYLGSAIYCTTLYSHLRSTSTGLRLQLTAKCCLVATWSRVAASRLRFKGGAHRGRIAATADAGKPVARPTTMPIVIGSRMARRCHARAVETRMYPARAGPATAAAVGRPHKH